MRVLSLAIANMERENLMKKNDVKKLSLSRETLVCLSNPDLGKIAGAAWSEESVCPTTAPSDCRPCA